MQLFSADATMFLKKSLFFFAHKKLKKPPSKVAQKNSNPLFFPYCPELPKRPKQKNLCSKMWPIDQLCIELGYYPLDTDTYYRHNCTDMDFNYIFSRN